MLPGCDAARTRRGAGHGEVAQEAGGGGGRLDGSGVGGGCASGGSRRSGGGRWDRRRTGRGAGVHGTSHALARPSSGVFWPDLPKGGDLHHHLRGAVRAESLIGYAARDGKCIDATTWVVAPGAGPCAGGSRPARDAEAPGPFRRDVIRAWSMRDFVLPPDGDPRPGHDHFFDTFGKFEAAATGHDADMLAEAARASAKEHSGYLETLGHAGGRAAEPARRPPPPRGPRRRRSRRLPRHA